MKSTDKLKNALNKKNIPTSLSHITHWISSGNMALNYIISGNFYKGIPNKRTSLFYGPSGTGKSFLLGNIARNAQQDGYHIIYFDSENSITSDFLEKIGVELDDDHFTPIRVHTIEETSEAIAEVFNTFDKDDKLAIFIDSLSMLEPEKTVEEFDKTGEMKADQGRKAKMLKTMVNMLNAKLSDRDMFCVMAGHAYESQDMYSGEKYVFSGGSSLIFVPSISVLLTKGKLKEGSEVSGFKLKAETKKTRFFKLGTKIELSVPYNKGMDPYDGVLEFLENDGYIKKNGAWYSYEHNGTTHKFQKKDFDDHYQYILPEEELMEPSQREEPIEPEVEPDELSDSETV